MDEQALRPIERRIRKLSQEGMPDPEIAWRFRRTPGYVRQVRRLAELPRTGADRTGDRTLRPLERRLLRWRDEGVDYPELAARFRRQPQTLERIEEMARFKLRQS